ncbi:MAG: hypothetical protein MUO76_11815 [Anaerolineaceae bacterium]|nr:hypothetical protein [Anaerolineaceae bacterium]
MRIQFLLKRIGSTLQPILTRYYWWAVLITFLCAIFLNGIGNIEREIYWRTALNPYERVDFSDENFFQASPLLPVLANVTDMIEHDSYIILCLGLFSLGYFMFAWLAKKRYGASTAWVLFLLIAAHPATNLMLSWFGTPDVITFLLTVLLIFTRPWPLFLLICALGAFNHPMIFIITPMILLLRKFSKDDHISLAHWIASGVGLLVGQAGVRAFLAINHIEIFSRLDFITKYSLNWWVENFLAQPFVLFFSFHGLLWVLIFAFVIIGFRRNQRYYITFIAMQVILCGITFFIADTTRVLTVLSWGTVIHCAAYTFELTSQDDEQGLTALQSGVVVVGLLSLVTPSFYVTIGEIYSPPIREFYTSKLPEILFYVKKKLCLIRQLLTGMDCELSIILPDPDDWMI